MIPEKAKKVLDGVLFDVYQWQQKMFDGSEATFERLLRKKNGANMIVVTEDNRLLFQTESRPDSDKTFTCLPCGGIEEGEDSLEGAKRELLEETGYVSDDWTLWKETTPGTVIDWKVFSYIVRRAKKVQEQDLDAGEKIEVSVITLDELLDHADKDNFLHTDIRSDLIRAKYHPESRKKLEQLLFGDKEAA